MRQKEIGQDFNDAADSRALSEGRNELERRLLIENAVCVVDGRNEQVDHVLVLVQVQQTHANDILVGNDTERARIRMKRGIGFLTFGIATTI